MPTYTFESSTDVLIKVTEYGTEIFYKKVYCTTYVDGDYFIFASHELETGKLQQQYRLLYSDCTNPSVGSAILLKTAVDLIINTYTKYYSDLFVGAAGANLTDAQSIYFGQVIVAPQAITTQRRSVYFNRSCTIVSCRVGIVSTVAGTAENWSLYIRVNNTTDYLVATVGVSANLRQFTNNALSISIVAGDFIEMKLVNPTWATNPTASSIGGYLTLEN